MKKIVVVGIAVITLAVAFAIYSAFQYGETSVLFAEGQVSLAPGLEDKATNARTLFITMFDSDSPSPMPYGAMRETIDFSPSGKILDFVLTPERIRVMNPSAPLPKFLRIKARLDLDGQGGMDQSGDLIGAVERVELGSKGVSIVIDQIAP